MHTPVETIPMEELKRRYTRCRELLAELKPEARGLLTFSRASIYYFTGTMGFGVFWLPLKGEPLLMVRKGFARACLESPEIAVAAFRSFGDLAGLAAERGAPFPGNIAAEQSSLPWALADNLRKRLPEVAFSDGDAVLSQARAVKTEWELGKMRMAGAGHAKATEEVLPKRITPGMSEMEIAHISVDVFYSLGSCGLTRMSNYGEEMSFGHISVEDNGNYPTFYNGALGCKGLHPAAPFLGCSGTIWKHNTLLAHDAGFCYQGYNSDKTLTYFAGRHQDIPPEVKKAHDVCRDIEMAVAEKMKPGVVPAELYDLAVKMAEGAGYADGFMGLGDSKVPFLGHGIGLCVDEWPVLARRFEKPLQTGMTIAMEPKIGLLGIGMVGVENTWEITDKGAVNLSGTISDIICVE